MISPKIPRSIWLSCVLLAALVNSLVLRPSARTGLLHRLHMAESSLTGPETTPLLDTIVSPADMKRLDLKQLKQLSHELRWETINAVSNTGGHLGSSLGVVELTVALHYIFDAPMDRIVWDVAHQAYPHKILTGRRSRMHTMRQLGGLSGFTERNESIYDCFGAGHSSTSISAGESSYTAPPRPLGVQIGPGLGLIGRTEEPASWYRLPIAMRMG